MALLPVRPITRPACLQHQDNGLLAQSILRSTPGQAGGPAVLLVEPAARAWRGLCAAALAAGHTLKSVSSYRPYADQERIFRERYVNFDTGNESRTWLGRLWWRRDGVAAAAVPGTSNHGWGLAVDIGEERDGDSGTESIDAGTVGWLVDHAATFGFSAEIQSEAWHWHYFAGDAIPAAVLAYEKPAPTPVLTPEDDDMALSYTYDMPGDKPTIDVIISGGKQVRLSGAAVVAARRNHPDHLGTIDAQLYGWLQIAHGKVIGVS